MMYCISFTRAHQIYHRIFNNLDVYLARMGNQTLDPCENAIARFTSDPQVEGLKSTTFSSCTLLNFLQDP